MRRRNDEAHAPRRALPVGGDGQRSSVALRRWEALRFTGIGLLFLSAMVSCIAGDGWMLFYTMAVAWLTFPLLVGPRNTMDAMCAFMLITVGMLVVVEVASEGPGTLLPQVLP